MRNLSCPIFINSLFYSCSWTSNDIVWLFISLFIPAKDPSPNKSVLQIADAFVFGNDTQDSSCGTPSLLRSSKLMWTLKFIGNCHVTARQSLITFLFPHFIWSTKHRWLTVNYVDYCSGVSSFTRVQCPLLVHPWMKWIFFSSEITFGRNWFQNECLLCHRPYGRRSLSMWAEFNLWKLL